MNCGSGIAVSARACVTPESGGDLADSRATDAHKWLNVPYDSGLAFVRDGDALRAAMSVSAAYLPPSASRSPSDTTPEPSRRARGVDIWAALSSLGRSGVADLVTRCCRYARRIIAEIQAEGTCWCGVTEWQGQTAMLEIAQRKELT